MRLIFFSFLLWVFSILSAFLAIKSSSEPILPILSGTWIELLFQQFDTGNSIIFDLSIGFIVSVFFYLLVVWLPDKQRKNLIKRNFEEQYKSFRRDTISVLLTACRSYDYELLLRLLDQNEFSKFIQTPIDDNPHNIKWYAIAQGLNEYHLKDLLVSLEIFMNEVAYVLNNIDINEPEVFAFFKRLSQAVYRLKNSTLSSDEFKPLENFILGILGGYDIIEGRRDYDIVKKMIDKI
jgi:hypothetical protein